jgi:hypothetical protein
MAITDNAQLHHSRVSNPKTLASLGSPGTLSSSDTKAIQKYIFGFTLLLLQHPLACKATI